MMTKGFYYVNIPSPPMLIMGHAVEPSRPNPYVTAYGFNEERTRRNRDLIEAEKRIKERTDD